MARSLKGIVKINHSPFYLNLIDLMHAPEVIFYDTLCIALTKIKRARCLIPIN
jgi:hypothetical protein